MHERKFYIDGAWTDPVIPALLDVIDPSTETAFTQISVGSVADVDRAVAAACAAFPSFARTSKSDRLEGVDQGYAGWTRTNIRSLSTA